MGVYILFDIGGTKTRVAVTEDLQTFRAEKFNTPKVYEEGIAAIEAAVKKLAPDTAYIGVAGGIRGTLGSPRDRIIDDSVLTDWIGKPLSIDLDRTFNAPVILRNDAAMAALGEATFGGGKGRARVSYHTISTGVGDALVVNGNVFATHRDMTSGPHTLENQISGTALEKKRGVKPYEIPQDDPVWNELAATLATGLIEVISEWKPDTIVLGGSMIIGDPRILREDIVRHTKELLGNARECPNIVDATLKDEAGLYGAMVYIRQKRVQDRYMKGIWTKRPFRWIAKILKIRLKT